MANEMSNDIKNILHTIDRTQDKIAMHIIRYHLFLSFLSKIIKETLFFKVILYLYLILKKINKRITDSYYCNIYT